MKPFIIVGLILVALGIVGLLYSALPISREYGNVNVPSVEGPRNFRKNAALPRGIAIGILVGGAVLVGAGFIKK